MTQTQRRILVAAAVLGGLAVAGCCGLGFLAMGFGKLGTDETRIYPNVTAEQQRTAARLTRLTFPPGTVFEFYHLEGFQDLYLSAVVRFPRRDLAAFLASGPLRDAKFSTTVRAVTRDLGGFDPAAVTRFRSASVEIPPNDSLTVLIDDADPHTVTIYLEFVDP